MLQDNDCYGSWGWGDRSKRGDWKSFLELDCEVFCKRVKEVGLEFVDYGELIDGVSRKVIDSFQIQEDKECF